MFVPFESILNLLEKHGISYQILEHRPVYTCEEAALVPGLPPSVGMKSLLIKTKIGNVLVVMAGDKRLDSKKLKKHLGVSDLSFAKPEVVKEIMGCAIGACYPFGDLIQVKTIVDPSLEAHQKVSFNPGRHDRTIIISTSDYLSINPHEIVDITL